jgi:hypothetical protein
MYPARAQSGRASISMTQTRSMVGRWSDCARGIGYLSGLLIRPPTAAAATHTHTHHPQSMEPADATQAGYEAGSVLGTHNDDDDDSHCGLCCCALAGVCADNATQTHTSIRLAINNPSHNFLCWRKLPLIVPVEGDKPRPRATSALATRPVSDACSSLKPMSQQPWPSEMTPPGLSKPCLITRPGWHAPTAIKITILRGENSSARDRNTLMIIHSSSRITQTLVTFEWTSASSHVWPFAKPRG